MIDMSNKKMKALLHFDDGTIAEQEISEAVLMEQMQRPKTKRLYKCGVEFSAVEKVEVRK